MNSLDADAASVQSHLSMLQGIIGRLAGNSASCKTWCVTLVSGIVVVVADKGRPELLLTAYVPVLLFFVLDSYYLALERWFRAAYETFVRKLHAGTASVEDVFVLLPKGRPQKLWQQILDAALSVSVWPFYGTLSVLLWIVGVRVVG